MLNLNCMETDAFLIVITRVTFRRYPKLILLIAPEKRTDLVLPSEAHSYLYYVNTSPRSHLIMACSPEFNLIATVPSYSSYHCRCPGIKMGTRLIVSNTRSTQTMWIKRGGRRGNGGLEYPCFGEFLRWERRGRATSPDTPRSRHYPGLLMKLLRAEGEFRWVFARRVIKFRCVYARSEYTG